MPACISMPGSAHELADPVAFDFSDTDEVDIGGGSPTIELQRFGSRTADQQSADQADMLAFCALWVFKDHPRRTRHGGVTARALPGL